MTAAIVRLAKLTLIAVALATPLASRAAEPVYTNWRGLAIAGTDPVAYFTEGRPVAGRAEHALEWNGATWRFASAEHLAAFRVEPERYAPRYGGYCAWAVAQGYTAKSDPEAWKIVDGKLYLNYDRSVQEQWEQDVPGNVREADANWPGVLER
jgi:YHS domain-containing protein